MSQATLSPAKHSVRFPGESEAYRSARDELLEEEIELRRHVEAVAAKRRTLPLGGEVPEDYAFEEQTDGGVRSVHLSELFAPGKDTLIVYSYMFGPQMAAPCVMCTSILDALDGEAPHVVQRVNLAVVARSPIERVQRFARDRDGGICGCCRRRRTATTRTITARRPTAISFRRSTSSCAAT